MRQQMYGRPTDGNASNPAGQDETMSFDGNINNKWLVYSNTGALTYEVKTCGINVNKYTVTSAEDCPERDPKDWVLEGSMDGSNWTALNTQTNQQFANRHQTNTYTFTNSNTYTFHRLRVTANIGGTGTYLQIADVALFNGDNNITAATMDFKYDASGNLLGFDYQGGTQEDGSYYYIRNGQGDIIGILDSNGSQVVTYVYNAWGMSVSRTGSKVNTIGNLNPFRYRGYYLDGESNFYYLNSRYYDPGVGRFLNADALLGANVGYWPISGI